MSAALTGSIKAKEGTYIAWVHNNAAATTNANKDFWGIEYNQDNTHLGKMEFGTSTKNKARFRVSGGSTGFGGINDTAAALDSSWKMISLVIKDGYATTYVNTSSDGSTEWYHPGG